MLLLKICLPLFLAAGPLPDPSNIGPDWWAQYTEGTEVEADLSPIQQLASELPEEEREKADLLIEQLQANLHTLDELKGESIEPAATPPTLDESYTLEQMLAVMAERHDADQQVVTLKRRVANGEARVKLALSHQNELQVQYRDEAAPSSRRFLLGLRLMVGRSTVSILRQRLRLLREELVRVQRVAEYLVAEQEHAQAYLRVTPEEVSVLAAGAEAASDEVRRQQQEVIAAQVTNGGIDGEDVLQRVERNLALARAQVARVDASARHAYALALNTPDWQELESLASTLSSDQQRIEEIREELQIWEDEIDLQVERAAQAGDDGREREAVVLIGEIRETVHEVARAEVVVDLLATRVRQQMHTLQSWWEAFWERVGSVWAAIVGGLSFTLFSVGELPITVLDIVQFILILVIGYFLSLGIRFLFGRLARRRHTHLSTGTLYVLKRVIHYVIMLITVVVAVSSLGLELDRILIIFGALSVGVGFGLQGLAGNFVAGLSILLGRKLKVGDIVELQSGQIGTVQTIHIQSTVFRTFNGLDVVIPNALLLAQPFENWTMRDPFRRFVIPFTVAYGSDKELVRQAGLEAAEAVDITLKKHKRVRDPDVRLIGFGENGLNFELVVWVNIQQVHRHNHIVAAYNWALSDALARHSLTIPFPQRDIHFKKSLPLSQNAPSV